MTSYPEKLSREINSAAYNLSLETLVELSLVNVDDGLSPKALGELSDLKNELSKTVKKPEATSFYKEAILKFKAEEDAERIKEFAIENPHFIEEVAYHLLAILRSFCATSTIEKD